jgi:IS1 family transposase
MRRLTTEKRIQIVSALIEGNSLRSVSRMLGVSLNAVTRFLVDLGDACAEYHKERVRGLATTNLQVDEIWNFVGAKARNVPRAKNPGPGWGSAWTWIGFDADSRLVITWLTGDRTARYAQYFMADIADRIASEKVQVTSDGLKLYRDAVRMALPHADFAQLEKIYASPSDTAETRYSPAVCLGCIRRWIQGSPLEGNISTSYVERNNLTMRMSMKRFARLTLGFSKKIENLRAAISVHMIAYNWHRIHRSLRETPAMAAGLADHPWELSEIVALLERKEQAAIDAGALKRGSYRKRQAKDDSK